MRTQGAVFAAVLLAAASMSVPAAEPFNHVDLYYTHSDIDIAVPGLSVDDSGEGFGIRGAARIADPFFVYGEYQTTDYDDLDFELTFIRGGLGAVLARHQNTEMYAKTEFVNAELDFVGDSADDTGLGAHAGVAFTPMSPLRLFAELGYLEIDGGDGLEWTVGGSFAFTPRFALLLDYRDTELDFQDGTELKPSDVQVGARYSF